MREKITEKHLLDDWHQERLTNWRPYFDGLVSELVAKLKPSLVLDIGCSDGLLLHSFLELGMEGYGIDISKDSVSYAPDKIKSNIILLDIEKEHLPFKDNTFDLITILEVLEHLHNHENILYEIHRVLKPDGLVLISSPIEAKALGVVNKLLSKVSKVREESRNPRDYEICDYAPHINVHPKKFWIQDFESNGFQCIEDFKRSHKKLIKKIVALHKPKERIAKFLVRFGNVGKRLRIELAYYLWSSTLVFKRRGEL